MGDFDFFRADLDELGNVLNTLRNARETTRDALQAMESADTGQLGTHELDDACAAFHKTWKYGLGQLEKYTDSACEAVDSNLTGYAEIEQAVADALQGKGA